MDFADERIGKCCADSKEQSVSGQRGRPFFRLTARKQVEDGESKSKSADDYFADLEIYNHMAHYVAKVLNQRPSDILDHWGVAELIVAFGQYANEKSSQNYEEWKQLDKETRAKTMQPSKYIVYFENE